MKKLLILLVSMVVMLSANAQYTSTDSLNGADTVYIVMTNAGMAQISCTQTGGTSDGTITAEASIDGSFWVPLDTTNTAWFDYSGNDTLTITDGATWIVTFKELYKYRFKAIGTAGDSTLLETSFFK